MYNQSLTRMQNHLSGIPEGTLLKQIYPNPGAIPHEHAEILINGKGRIASWNVFPGVDVVFQEYLADQISCCHEPDAGFLEITYCRFGRIGWNMEDGHSIYLGPGDFSIHTRQLCAGSVMTLPNRHYEGLSIHIHLSQFDRTLPDLLAETEITGQMLSEKFCPHGTFTTFTGNEQTDAIFAGYYDKSEKLKQTYFVLKTLELLLYLSEQTIRSEKEPGKYQADQIAVIREIHDYLLQHMDKKITIEELSKKYLMNPTTLKSVFKAVYGDSLAAHMKEHRLEKAAALLSGTNDSIAQIANAVGYGSQSRFSAAFQEVYQCLPLEYRKMHTGRKE